MSIHMLATLGWPEIIGVLVVALLLFGAKKLPELARGLGQGIKEFKKATKDVQNDIERAMDEEAPPPPRKKPDPRPEESDVHSKTESSKD